MNVDSVDPRDLDWEKDDPVYRVYFWHQPGSARGVWQENVMFHCEEYRLSGAVDVDEVLDWARRTARPEQTFVLYVEHQDSHGTGPIRLRGTNPNAPHLSARP